MACPHRRRGRYKTVLSAVWTSHNGNWLVKIRHFRCPGKTLILSVLWSAPALNFAVPAISREEVAGVYSVGLFPSLLTRSTVNYPVRLLSLCSESIIIVVPIICCLRLYMDVMHNAHVTAEAKHAIIGLNKMHLSTLILPAFLIQN